MALTKTTEDVRIEVVGPYKAVQVRTDTVIKDGSDEISRKGHRRVIHPCIKNGDTWSNTVITGESSEIQAVCNAVWTDAIRTAYKDMVDARDS